MNGSNFILGLWAVFLGGVLAALLFVFLWWARGSQR